MTDFKNRAYIALSSGSQSGGRAGGGIIAAGAQQVG